MARKQKLNFKPTPISRLLKQKLPFKMVGDPHWSSVGSISQVWANRQKAVYEDALILKRGGWTDALYRAAHDHNSLIDMWELRKWDDWIAAWEERKWEDYDIAHLENHNMDYEREHFIPECFDTAA